MNPPARSPGSRRGSAALAIALLPATMGCVLVTPAGAAVPTGQPLVTLLHGHDVRMAPSVRARRIEHVSARRPLTGVHTVLPILGRATSADGRAWVQVLLPGRPNGHRGWIPAAQTRRTRTAWRLSVTLSTRRLTVYQGARAVRRFATVVGKPSTPTPRGRFFIEEALALSPQAAGGPYALASSARSDVLQEFDGGPGQIALHGTHNLPGALGTASSHGCVRLSPRAITWVARHIAGGTPLTITR